VSFVEKRDEFRPNSGEAPFDLDEVFFSRTDTRGVIQSGNYVFKRVANFDWSELIGAPHKLIRHPDMPKAVFWLLWTSIQNGNPIGAYIKNRAKDGLYYWVFAVVAPMPGGFLSARIKPTTDMLTTIASEYEALRGRELEENLSPEESATELLSRLNVLGFPDYDSFSSSALVSELIARDTALGKKPAVRTTALNGALAFAEDLKHETEALITDFKAMETVPHNLRVIASRMEPTGGPISTLSQNYGSMSRDMSDWFEAHVMGKDSNFAGIRSSVLRSIFIHSMSRILQDCVRQLSEERRDLNYIDIDAESDILKNVVATYAGEAARSAQNVQGEARRILDACNRMDRHVLGLSTTRVMCKIESARLTNSGESLQDIIAQLKVFQDRISTRLDQIIHLGHEIENALS